MNPEINFEGSNPFEQHVVPQQVVDGFWNRYLERAFGATNLSSIRGSTSFFEDDKDFEQVTEFRIVPEDGITKRVVLFRQEFHTPLYYGEAGAVTSKIVEQIIGYSEESGEDGETWESSVGVCDPVEDFLYDLDDGDLIGYLVEVLEISFEHESAPEKTHTFEYRNDEDEEAWSKELVSGFQLGRFGEMVEVVCTDYPSRLCFISTDFNKANGHLSSLTYDDLKVCFDALKQLKLISPRMVFDERFTMRIKRPDQVNIEE